MTVAHPLQRMRQRHNGCATRVGVHRRRGRRDPPRRGPLAWSLGPAGAEPPVLGSDVVRLARTAASPRCSAPRTG
ncbi:MAG: hypothetical protein AVDCRST_MAG66-3935 [uncultured Pseudonocardia sp.]|uniref:Uncharacterized protein n=1 Tax=uncultured Pseudonocardia sp. TaxID=211455 RepID=A0A6J4QE75_9PSEU|nr:MAG: hypothetical protein AVDCRST_MAG66-3935 [uncultured Pseudonocardia sp.]